MSDKLYYFNPEHDMALANFTPYYKSPAEIIRMANDLSALPVWYAEKGDYVKVSTLTGVPDWERQCAEIGIVPEAIRVTDWRDMLYCPWGWNPALLHVLRNQGVSEKFLLSDERMNKIRYLSGRQRCIEVLPFFSDLSYVCGEAFVCSSLKTVMDFVKQIGDVILKSPWSGSGRGLVYVSPDSWNLQVEGWVSRILRTQGDIMVEPRYKKTVDFAMEFYSDGEGNVSFVGYSLFETDLHGNYKANVLASDEWIECFLGQYVSPVALDTVRVRLLERLKVLVGLEYVGYLGVDMMVCAEVGERKIHPCVEINLRMNMGVVAHTVFARYVHPQVQGKYVIEHYNTDGEALNIHRKLLSDNPPVVSGGKIQKGYLSLTPVSEHTRYQAYLLV